MEIKLKTIELDFSNIENLGLIHTTLKHIFGFPDFYGKNVNALIDCWSSLRYPEDKMCSFSVASDESIVLKIKGLSSVSNKILLTLLVAVEEVNRRSISRKESPLIYIEPI